MRCVRCDRIAVPQVLARLPDGRLAFGWCRNCVREARGEVLYEGRVGGRRRLAVGPRRRSRLLPRAQGKRSALLVRIPRQRSALRAIRHGTAVGSLLLIVLGIVRHDPRRDPLIVLAAFFALTISVFVGWLEQHLEGTPARRPTEVL